MSDTTLYSAILINGGRALNDSDKLFPRELYITPTGEMVVGDFNATLGNQPNASPIPVIVGKALQSERVLLDRSGLRVKFDDNDGVLNGADISGCYVGPFGSLSFGNSYIKHQDGALKMSLTSTSTINGGVLMNNTISSAKLNLSTASYGSKDTMNSITNPQAGDIFIVI